MSTAKRYNHASPDILGDGSNQIWVADAWVANMQRLLRLCDFQQADDIRLISLSMTGVG